MAQYSLEISYLIASIAFIIGLKFLGHPETARKGNIIAAIGMFLAVITTIFLYKSPEGKPLGNYVWIFGGIIIGSIVGTLMAKKVQMTAMPQMVSLFNGVGAACVALISVVEFSHYNTTHTGNSLFNGLTLTIILGSIIGCISFSGSIIAWGKLEGKIKDIYLPANQLINIVLMLSIIGTGVYLMMQPSANLNLLLIISVISLIYGILFVFPIGGADMPVVISLLNSFTGVAAACGGFLYNNQAMLTGGILVGSSGTILTILMCKAMNRSLTNVIIGAFSNPKTKKADAGGEQKVVKEISVTDCAVLMSYSKKVIIVPGYGLAVAQAQHICHELEKTLEEKGVEVLYAIHPVAGRMPGHMNVLLAEADVPYPKLLEMDEINPEFSTTDVALVIGANDVVNPAAKNDKDSPIYGMPILDVENAKNIIINKRSMNAGYAGIDNELFYDAKTKMLFGDAKGVLQKLVAEVKAN
ncbi:MAG: NAD(P)(+) transhydrogenase (Re/Si-specific) subunit beta [Ignavibacteria bacterium]|nr:NAD(P)(+) transhydrogenase (Re/Si-specific) subunit beta [Ignavibacteria bacterium]